MLRIPIVLILNLFALLRYAWSTFWYGLGHLLRRKYRHYVVVDLQKSYAFGPPGGWMRYLKPQHTFLEFREDIKRLARDKRIDGVVVIPDQVAMGAGRSAELAELFDDVRAHGKHVVAHLRMATYREYDLAMACDDVVMAPAGRLYMFGMRIDQLFGAQTLEKLGVVAQFVHIGAFKTASHRFIHDSMTSPQRLMMQSLLDSFHDIAARRMSERRGLTTDQVDAAYAKMPLDPRQSAARGLIDGESFRSQMDVWLEQRGEACAQPEDAKPRIKTLSLDDFASSSPRPVRLRPLLRPRRFFAVMDLSGPIIMPEMPSPGGGSANINPEDVLPKLRAIAENKRAAGLLLHINSPGGSALASDLVWNAIREVARKKPVVAYCTDVAASGGYYLAVACHHILCRPETMMGSIGVITGKMSVPGTLEKVGVHIESLYDRPTATFTSLYHPLNQALLDNLCEDARSFYRRFLQRVGQARQIPRRSLHRYARGRVYLGEQALGRGLVDGLGNFQSAIDFLVQKTGLSAEKTPLRFVAHKTPSMRDLLRQSAHVDYAWMNELIEPARLAAMLQIDPVLAMMPYRIDIR